MDVLSALARSCGLELRRALRSDQNGFAGVIVLDPPGDRSAGEATDGRHSIRVTTADRLNAATTVCFSAGLKAPFPFRGRSILTDSAAPDNEATLVGEVIATANGKPIWATDCTGGFRQDTCRVGLPWVTKGRCVFEHLNANRFLDLLPLLEWLRSISDWGDWSHGRLQACFMFDDPNLHSARYGFVRFKQLAEEGKRHGYHTSFATVPLDAYYVNPRVARIFRQNRETLSLLMHGNNHIHRELAWHATFEQQADLMRQAVVRIRRLEKKAEMSVSRVMAPPHGVCSAEMMAAMTVAGLEAVCVSHGSVWTGNPGARWTVALGAFPALVVAGLPVIPRFGLAGRLDNSVLLAAYLRQPIVPVGHHWDLAEGTGVLESAARLINSLGSVAWADLTGIARNNYRYRVEGETMRVYTLSRITAVNVPEGVSEIQLEVPWLDPQRDSVQCLVAGGGMSRPFREVPGGAFCFRADSGTRVDLVVQSMRSDGEPIRTFPRTPLRTIARKAIVELRDRIMPCLPRRWVRR